MVLLHTIVVLLLIEYSPVSASIPSSIPRSTTYTSSTLTDEDTIIDGTTNNNKKRYRWMQNNILWNPSSKIDSHGFIDGTYQRIPGEWEEGTNLPGKYGPKSKYFRTLLSSPTTIRQVPGDGNCLFHSITVALCAVVNQTHIHMSTNPSHIRSPTTRMIRNPQQRRGTKNDYWKHKDDDEDVDPEEEEEEEEEEENIDQEREWKDFDNEEVDTEIDNINDWIPFHNKRKRGTKHEHYPTSTLLDLHHLYTYSRYLRHQAVNALSSKSHRLLFLQGNEYLRPCDLVEAAAAQYDITGEEYCTLMRKDSYWGGGPEIVALCNVLKRPIHVYELCSTWTRGGNKNNKDIVVPDPDDGNDDEEEDLVLHQSLSSVSYLDTTTDGSKCTEFRLRRMACFGSPKFDRREPLHILSADSRFPDIEPGKQNASGNHFLVLLPQEYMTAIDHAQKVRYEKKTTTSRRQKNKRVRGGARDQQNVRKQSNKKVNKKHKMKISEKILSHRKSSKSRNLLDTLVSLWKNMTKKLY